MTIRKVRTESELRTYLAKPYWDCILIDGVIDIIEPIYVDRSVTIMGGRVNYIGLDADLLKSAAFIVSEALFVSFIGVDIIGSPALLQSGIIVNHPRAIVIVTGCLIYPFAYAGIWQFASSKVTVSNSMIIGTEDATKGYNYGVWQGGKSSIPEQRLYVTASRFSGSRHAIGASYHPNSYYVTGCNVSSLKHSFDRHNWNAGGRKGGLHTVISGNTFTDPDRLAFSIEPPYEGGHFSFTGNKLNHAASRHVGEISYVRVYEGDEEIRGNEFTN